jgi:predicted RNA-binding protein Jag
MQDISKAQGDNTEKNYEVEVDAVTIEEAIRKALRTLNVNRESVTIKVLKEEHKGLFGMQGAELAKIKVALNAHKIA